MRAALKHTIPCHAPSTPGAQVRQAWKRIGKYLQMMATTTTSTTTAIELEQRLPVPTRGGPASSSRNSFTNNSSDANDPILQASQLADADVPEGGYGWVVVASCAVLSWWVVGTAYSWGVVQGALVEQGGLGSPAVLSFVGSLSSALLASIAIINARIVRFVGVKHAALLGVGMISSASILSSFAVGSIGGLFVTEGVLRGLGSGLCFTIASSTPAQYFVRRRGLANGIVFAGGGLGGAIISIALDPLIRRLGPAWAFRILGLSCLATGLPAAWFVKERTRSPRTVPFVEWRLFKNPSFVLVLLAGAVGTFPLLVPPFFIPLYARAINLSPSTGAALLAGFNFASAVGRIVSGMLCDLIGPLNSLFLSMLLSAVSMLAVWPASVSLAPMAVFVIVNGLANGGFFSTMPTVVGNVFGSARLGVAMGMVVTTWAGGYLMGAPIAGYLLAAYGGQEAGFQAYRPAMFYAGSMALAAAILVQGVRFRQSRNLLAKL
ncbi:MFS transporter MCT family solute carrier family 16 (monocarboxylic acid transporters) member 10 [Microdochium nivale]|nr:MFS transporter MCT family solute carrier family 16 (monocarboxylic acid transporters) member 10 [Microdochium nivale]